MKFAYRALSFVARLAAGAFHFGLWGALRVFVLLRFSSSDTPASLPLRQTGRRFWFRSRSDRGVLGMFYNPNYRLIDGYGPHQVRFIIDAGANIGDSTVRLRRFHPTARILAIEADAGNFAMLEKNCVSDALTTPLLRGLWSHEGQLTVQSQWANVASRVSEAQGSGTVINACTIPGLMREFGATEIDILKLDIEGAESVVFQTEDRAWLQHVRCIIFECCDADDPGTTATIYRALQESGVSYNSHLCGENIVLIRSDTPWHVVMDLWLEPEPEVPPHIAAWMAREGFQKK